MTVPVLTVAVVGAGRMGSAVATILAESGATVRVWNRSAARAEALRGERIIPTVELGAAITGADAVLSVLTDGPAVRATLAGIAESLSPHAVLIEASTIDPPTMASVAHGIEERVVSCAVSGTPAVVLARQAGVLISGHPDAKTAAGRVLSSFAARSVDVGARVEDAKLVKIGINALLAGTMELLAESAVLLEASGVGRAVFAQALAGSVLHSTFAGYKLSALEQRDYTATFATRDLRKDIALALEQGKATGVILPFAHQLADLLDDAVERGWGDLDFLSLVPRLQEVCGLPSDLSERAVTA